MSPANLRSFFRPSSPVRRVTDAMWLVAFFAIFGVMALGNSSAFSTGADGDLLHMMQGAQRMGLYLGDKRLGTVQNAILREENGWRVSTRFTVGMTEVVNTQLTLHPDLSLFTLRVDADISRLVRLGGITAFLLGKLDGVGRIHVRGSCALETGVCQVMGELAGKKVNLPITAGRGPVLTSAIYPLLAQGKLGREAELGIFDPLSLGRRILTFRVQGVEQLTLHSGAVMEAVRIQRDLEGVSSSVWVDRDGRVLKENLPIGITMEHEAFLPLTRESGK